MANLPDPSDRLDPQTKAVYDQMAGERGALFGFYPILFYNPAIATRIGGLGSYFRFQGKLPAKVRETVILTAGRVQRMSFEWRTHQEFAARAGLTPGMLEAILTGDDLSKLDPDLAAPAETARLVALAQPVPQTLHDRLVAQLGVEGAVEVIALASFYRMIAGLAAAYPADAPGTAMPDWRF